MKSLWIEASLALLCSMAAVSGSDFIVNTTHQCVTDNWMDGGATYWYRLNGDVLEYKTGGANWQSPPTLPYTNCRFKNIAANSNRLLGLTTSNELYLATIKRDMALWVQNLLGVIAFAGDLSHPILVAMGVYKEGYGYQLGTAFYPTPWHWATAYQQYLDTYHAPWAWAPIARAGLDYGQIQDIAVGNWNGTVTTVYVLDAVSNLVYYIDEEPVMLGWKPVTNSHTLGLNNESRIDADHSVICATTSNTIYWVRFDYQQPDNEAILLLNWTEFPYEPLWTDPFNYPGWHHIGNPTGQPDGFRIDVRCADGTPWPVPEALGIGYITDAEGLFGFNPLEPPWEYPFRLTMKYATGMDDYFRMRLRHAKEMDTLPANVVLDGGQPFAFAVPLGGDDHYFGTQTYSDPNTYLSPLTEDCYIHAKNNIIITNNITVNPAPGRNFRAVAIPAN